MLEKSRENYLRVTRVLEPFSGLHNVHPDVVAYAGERGTKVHKICEGIARGLGELGVDDETWGYVESFKQWWGEGQTVIDIERRFYDDDLKVTGQVDFIIDTPDGLAIVDIKTSSKPSKTWPYQGSGYFHLAKYNGIKISKIYFLHLNKHGKAPKLIEYIADDTLFLAVLIVFRHFFSKDPHDTEYRQSKEVA